MSDNETSSDLPAVAAGGAHVYTAISEITAEMGKVGIAKISTTEGLKYKFRGIDAVYQALSPLLAAHKLCILPRVLSRQVEKGVSNKCGAMFHVALHVEFDLVSALDGSTHTVAVFGEAMDSSDKATNKAMSAAYKYMAIPTFCIPVEGEPDADAGSPEVVATHQKPKPEPTPPQVNEQAKAKAKAWLASFRDEIIALTSVDAVHAAEQRNAKILKKLENYPDLSAEAEALIRDTIEWVNQGPATPVNPLPDDRIIY